jgi:preprotein translocase subunit SecF
MLKDKIEHFWNKNYKWLMFIPVLLLVLSLVSIGIQVAKTGDFIKKDVSLRGGIAATIYTDREISTDQIKSALEVESEVKILGDVTTGKTLGYVIEVSDLNETQLKSRLHDKLDLDITQENFSLEVTTPKLSQAFFKQLLIALIFAFILMGVTVFITFRTPAPSIAVIAAAFMDITITLGIINFFGINLSTAGIVAFLMVIGYSVDTDILLTNYAIKKRDGRLFDRMYHSMQTGLTMTICAIGVMLTGLIISNSVVIREMFLILTIALIIDIITTYLTNAGILWIYCKRKNIQ